MAYVYVGGYDPTIREYKLDLTSGRLSPNGTVNGGENPSFLAWDPLKKYLYAVNEIYGDGSTNPGRVLSFAIDPNTGGLTPLNSASSGGSGPAHLSVHPSGKWLLTANYDNGHIATLPIQSNGFLKEPSQTIQPVPNDAHMILSDSSGKFVFVTSTASDVVLQYIFDLSNALAPLTPNSPPQYFARASANPRHLTFHPSLPYAYVVNEAGSSVTSFNYDVARGTLSEIETSSTIPSSFSGANTGAEIALHPNGKFVYASNRGHNSIAIFSVDLGTGRLTLTENSTANGKIKTPRHFMIDPSGKYLLVANQDANSILVMSINSTTGSLTSVGVPVTVPQPSFVGVIEF